jgi:hypothetical protein
MIRDAIEHAFEEKLIVLSSPCVHASFPLLPLGGVCLDHAFLKFSIFPFRDEL